MKKILAIVTAVVIILAMGVSSFASLDCMYANNNVLQMNGSVPNPGFAARATVNIEPGDRLYILGWAAMNGAVLEKIYWTLDGDEKECADIYRDRPDLLTAGVVSDEEYTVHAGYGNNEDMMELLGVDALEEGEYTVSIVALFDDGTEVDVKSEFDLIVGKQEEKEPVKNDQPKRLEVDLYVDGTSGLDAVDMDDGSILCETLDPTDPWVSIVLDEIDTSIYTSFTVYYEIEGSLHGNNVYLRDMEHSVAYTPTAGTWTQPGMNGLNKRTFVISDEFGLLDNTILTGIRFPGATGEGTLTIKSIVFHNPNGVGDDYEIRDFNAETDKQYFDQILVNGEQKANGNDAVAALKANLDGSDGSVKTIGMWGWFGWVDAETPYTDLLDSYGYIIDNGSPVFDASFSVLDSEPEVTGSNGLRYHIIVDVSELGDGQNHVIKGCVKLTNGEVVIFNRENREAIINYKAPLNATPVPTEAPTEVPTEAPTAAPTAAPTDAPTAAPEATAEATAKPAGNGCGNFAMGGAALIALAAAAFIAVKRKEN